MKKMNLSKKLSLNKETVAKLNNTEMSQINGGAVWKTWVLSRCITGPSGTAYSCPTYIGACTGTGTGAGGCDQASGTVG